jgi:hypothetical protein
MQGAIQDAKHVVVVQIGAMKGMHFKLYGMLSKANNNNNANNDD